MTYDYIDELNNSLNINGSIRVPLNNREEGEVIGRMLEACSYSEIDLGIYSNCSGQLLLWVAFTAQG